MTTRSDMAVAMPSLGAESKTAGPAMTSRYDPKDHVQPLVVAPRSESILDQREITITSYQTTVPFDFLKLSIGLDAAWLAPHVRLGVFSRMETSGRDSLNIVLGLQDDLTVRAYDYDERQPLWYSWQNVIVETANVHFHRDESGLLRFTVTGGGRRITEDRLYEFNSSFLEVPSDAVSKFQFDLKKLRELCFKRFVERLYTIRFTEPSGDEYRSIDHALFQSQKYIDPDAKRLKELCDDPLVKVESFESDITLRSDDLAEPVRIRFHIRGVSGSLRLRFPKMVYKDQIKTPEEQATVFYRIVNAAVTAVLDADYYSNEQMTLDDLSVDLGMFRDAVDLAPFRKVLANEEQRTAFISRIDLGEMWHNWSPHLRVIDELVASDVVAVQVRSELTALVKRDPEMAIRLLEECQGETRAYGLGAIVASELAQALQEITPELRAQAEERLLSWAVDREIDSWDVDPETNEFCVLTLRRRLDDLSLDAIPPIIWKLVGVLHSRLIGSDCDIGPLLQQFDWCMTIAKSLSPNHTKSPAALRLVAAERVPRSFADAARVLKNPVDHLPDVDTAVLDQFGLPLWPLLSASQRDGMLVLSNDGIGAAWAVTVKVSGDARDTDESMKPFALLADETKSLPACDSAAVEVHFEKMGRTYRVTLPIAGEFPPVVAIANARTPSRVISRKRLDAQREYRKKIDPDGIVIGSSPALLEVFEHIHHANAIDPLAPVLILGERGVGKTHFAKLLHDSSSRHKRPYKEVNAGGSGGDVTIQRTEWIGCSKGHGIQGIDPKGRPGHLMSANGGTLFIDEFAGLSPDLQFIFLSVLESRSVEKVGGESHTPNVRCIFATNADIDSAVEGGSLRRDLVDRIPVTFRIPSLHERRADVLPLAKHAAGGQEITERGRLALLRHDWPGNVRELRGSVSAALARMRIDEKVQLDVAHFELPASIVRDVETLDDDACRRELWNLADAIARDEGFDLGTGLQRRMGEILGVSAGQVSKMYREYGLAPAASA